MTKQELFDAFDQKISKKAIVSRGDEYVIQGRFCVIAFEEPDLWDIWVCNPDDLYSGLGAKKVRNICAELIKSAVNLPVRELTGETDTRTRDKGVILNNLSVLGIRKKRQVSPKQLEKMRIRMRKLKEANQ